MKLKPKFPTLFRKAVVGILFPALGLMITAQGSYAESFSIDGISLNSNSNFRRIDGNPRMSIWESILGDSDQQFDRLPGENGAILLRHRSTGKCLNFYRKKAGQEFNVWACNPQDPDQNVFLNNLGENVVQIQLAGTKLCVDSPTRKNGGTLYLWGCDANNPNQRWLSTLGGDESVATGWRLPWKAGVTAKVSQTWHVDTGWKREAVYALDFALPAGTPVLAPIDSEVLKVCNAGNNHLAMRLLASDGQEFSLTHVQASGIEVGTRFKAGQRIGYIAGDKPWNNCARSTGAHLHFGLPSKTFQIGNYQLQPSIQLYTELTSNNR